MVTITRNLIMMRALWSSDWTQFHLNDSFVETLNLSLHLFLSLLLHDLDILANVSDLTFILTNMVHAELDNIFHACSTVANL
jgi:hypothetical protein